SVVDVAHADKSRQQSSPAPGHHGIPPSLAGARRPRALPACARAFGASDGAEPTDAATLAPADPALSGHGPETHLRPNRNDARKRRRTATVANRRRAAGAVRSIRRGDSASRPHKQSTA